VIVLTRNDKRFSATAERKEGEKEQRDKEGREGGHKHIVVVLKEKCVLCDINTLLLVILMYFRYN
jgi:hypothetical protein